jgi:hypothetical protein
VHAEAGSEERVAQLRRCTYSGKPYGEEAFVAAMEEQFRQALAALQKGA